MSTEVKIKIGDSKVPVELHVEVKANDLDANGVGKTRRNSSLCTSITGLMH